MVTSCRNTFEALQSSFRPPCPVLKAVSIWQLFSLTLHESKIERDQSIASINRCQRHPRGLKSRSTRFAQHLQRAQKHQYCDMDYTISTLAVRPTSNASLAACGRRTPLCDSTELSEIMCPKSNVQAGRTGKSQLIFLLVSVHISTRRSSRPTPATRVYLRPPNIFEALGQQRACYALLETGVFVAILIPGNKEDGRRFPLMSRMRSF